MSCCGLGKRMGCNRTELTTVKMALLAPIPRARAIIETQAKPGLPAKVRAAYLRSRRADVNIFPILNGVVAFLSRVFFHRCLSDCQIGTLWACGRRKDSHNTLVAYYLR